MDERYDGPIQTALGAGADPGFLRGKNADQVFEAAKEYEPPASMSEDAAEAFEAYVKDNPSECSRKAPELGSAHYDIQRGLFLGLRDAVRDGERIEWGGVLSLGRGVVERRLDAQRRAGPGVEAQEQGQLLPLFWLMEDGFKKNSIDYGLKDEAWSVLEGLVEIGAVYGEYEEYPGRDGALDISLNNLNGGSFHAVYQYASWRQKHCESRTLVPEAKRIFDEYLDGDGHTVSRHAVLGIFLPGFYYLDQEWARRVPNRIPSSERAKIAFWDGYVSGKQMYSYAFGDLWQWYDEFMNGHMLRSPDLARLRGATAGHVMLAYFYDLERADAIVERLFEKNDPEAVRLCVEQTGPILAGKRGDPNFDKARLAGLWRRPPLRGHNLDTWFISTPLDDETAIGLYRDHIVQYTGKINAAYNPVYKLAGYAADFPLEVAECLEALVPKHAGSAVPDAAYEILDSLSASKDPRVTDKRNKIGMMLKTPSPRGNIADPAKLAAR